ncbi:hypothetical protein P4U05_18480 [Bacillus paranthracis]|uniref:hypothetical protein n=1 Tax=Bacillus cereus group TaxID=86661 RepID=UPI000200F519|nr:MULTISPECIES: hypothetical protein [Bacillus cereus group]ADY24916.1 hypothetical protein YBT020_28811 [Bacillus thuringiensis serovar finitimus YBT-020]MRC74507.1 hypothetical protein [Bacillus thuringiensis]OTX69086.1 hypothetical protein BK722_18105 [Bacillus thuringiensis serovar finitimus]MEC3360840.1 hypothetical protein [Bacillus paranthracis]MED0786451.1 hypothetical protein [Bacillus paranthracis]
MVDNKREDIVLREAINDNCYELLVANNGPGFNHFVLHVDHDNNLFHIFDPITLAYLDYARGTAADQHFYGNNLREKICSSLELDPSTYDKVLIYTPDSNAEGFHIQPHGFGVHVPKKFDTYEPFVMMAKTTR